MTDPRIGIAELLDQIASRLELYADTEPDSTPGDRSVITKARSLAAAFRKLEAGAWHRPLADGSCLSHVCHGEDAVPPYPLPTLDKEPE
jgi:hypothetical protein